MVHATRLIGDQGEKAVALFLGKQGYIILASNVQWMGGEIDLIAQRGDVIAFVEVKTRTQETRFPLSGVVTPGKQRKIIKTALRFVMQNNIRDTVLRFDVALVMLQPGQQPDIYYISHAFTAPTE